MSSIDVPAVIDSYQRAHDRRDVEAALASFGPDATVIDEAVAYRGTERIRWWLTNAASEFTYTRSLTGVEDLGGGAYLVSNHLSGNFPGGEADLRYRFQLRGGLIDHVEIAP
ncbi:MAG: nuclear transport factor 2 family protein [Acidimicrobiia bacterium]